jgi:hypothetical protein
VKLVEVERLEDLHYAIGFQNLLIHHYIRLLETPFKSSTGSPNPGQRFLYTVPREHRLLGEAAAPL